MTSRTTKMQAKKVSDYPESRSQRDGNSGEQRPDCGLNASSYYLVEKKEGRRSTGKEHRHRERGEGNIVHAKRAPTKQQLIMKERGKSFLGLGKTK